MSINLKPTKKHTLVSFGGGRRFVCLQITEKNPQSGGTGYVTVNKEQALELAIALIEFASDTRDEVNS